MDRIARRYRDVIDAYRDAQRRRLRHTDGRQSDAVTEARAAIKLLLADVDGTLVTQDKVLTDRAIAAVRKLHDAGIVFAITSGRPPRGMAMLIEPLDIQTPIAAFNGGLVVDRDMNVLEQRVLPEELVVPVADTMASFSLDVWLYRGADWYVPKRGRPACGARGLDGEVRAQDHDGRRQRADRRRGQTSRRQRRYRRGGASDRGVHATSSAIT